MQLLKIALVAALLTACGDDDGAGPNIPDVDARGNYQLTELGFDPQGSLSNVDLRARITGTLPRLVLANRGRAQLVYTDPQSGLVTTVEGEYVITAAGAVQLSFAQNTSLYQGVFLSRRMTFEFDEEAGSLTFSGTSPDGVARQRLLALVPEWSDEQLFDPVPGELRIVFRVD